MHGQAPPTPEELSALIRLLDDDTPEVRAMISARLLSTGGDISEELAALPVTLSRSEAETLSGLLSEARRETLEREWLIPSGGAGALREDWDSLESLLRLISDFLHDGITCRQPLSDGLDLLAEEAAAREVQSAGELAVHLFGSGLLKGNRKHYDDPRNSDLAWCIAEGKSNPIGLCVILILVARRLELTVEAVNFPGHFLCRIHEGGLPVIIDCYNGGQTHDQAQVLDNPGLSQAARIALRQNADPGAILIRMLNNLHAALLKVQRTKDAQLVRMLRDTLD